MSDHRQDRRGRPCFKRVLAPPRIGFCNPKSIEARSLAGLRHRHSFMHRLHAQLQHSDIKGHCHWLMLYSAPRASFSAIVFMPEPVISAANSATLSIGVLLGSNGPTHVSPLMSKPTCPGPMGCPAGNVVPRITYFTFSAIISSFPTPFCTEHTALLSSKIC